jgi:hypothetical protein
MAVCRLAILLVAVKELAPVEPNTEIDRPWLAGFEMNCDDVVRIAGEIFSLVGDIPDREVGPGHAVVYTKPSFVVGDVSIGQNLTQLKMSHLVVIAGRQRRACVALESQFLRLHLLSTQNELSHLLNCGKAVGIHTLEE